MSFMAEQVFVGPVACDVEGVGPFELTITPTAYRMSPGGDGTLRMTMGYADGVVAPEGAMFAVLTGPLLDVAGVADGIVARSDGRFAIGLVKGDGIVTCEPV